MALAIRKYCACGKNININGGSCTDHLAKEDKSGQGQKISNVFFLFPRLEPVAVRNVKK